MAWNTPTLVEICIGLEINGYLPADSNPHRSSFGDQKPGQKPGFNFGTPTNAINHNGSDTHLGGGCGDLDCRVALAAWACLGRDFAPAFLGLGLGP